MTNKETRGRIRIAFFLGSMSGGGAERVVLNILKSIDTEIFSCLLIVKKDKGEYKQEFLKLVEVKKLGGNSFLQRAKSLKNLLRENQADVVLSYARPANYLLIFTRMIFRLKNIKTAINEVNNLTAKIDLRYSPFKKKLIRKLTPFLYTRVDFIVTQSEGIKNDLVQNYKVPEKRITRVYNAIDIDAIFEKRTEDIDEHLPEADLKMVAVGRLEKQKAFDQLIKAVSRLEDIDYRLLIIGEGTLKETLQRQIDDLGLQDRVRLLGFKNNPWAYMYRSDLFILSSIFEGFGNVIVEAMACKCAVISTDCDFGPPEIIQHGRSGLLVPVNNVEAVESEIRNLNKDKSKLNQLAMNAEDRSRDFHRDLICQEFEKLIEEKL